MLSSSVYLIVIVLLSSTLPSVLSFVPSIRRSQRQYAFKLNVFKVAAEELEKDLSLEEKTTVRVVREAGPQVAFVTSVWPMPSSRQVTRRNRQRPTANNNNLPQGQPLGSGSAFVVDARGYLVTNFHVVERAYQIQQSTSMFQELQQNYSFPLSLFQAPETAHVYVRMKSEKQYQKARIVNVQPDLDVAVLQLVNRTTATTSSGNNKPLSFGSSSDLLVGQNLIAIGNPFGLETTVTTGVVSALGRDIFTSSDSTPIRNCIQTDCAINPGNSGGPLFNTKGQVVGVNTAIVTTSGSNAGVGFAVPSDQVRPVVEEFIRKDLAQQKVVTLLGVKIAKQYPGGIGQLHEKNWIAHVVPNSPADKAGMQALQIDKETARIANGQAIVAIGGNAVSTYDALQKEMASRKPGEQLQVTLENWNGGKSVVYVMLDRHQ